MYLIQKLFEKYGRLTPHGVAVVKQVRTLQSDSRGRYTARHF